MPLRTQRDNERMAGDIGRLLNPLPGPNASTTASRKRLFLSMVEASHNGRPHGIRLGATPLGLIAGGALFGVLTLGAAAAGGVGLDGTVEELLATVGVELPESAQSHLESLPRRPSEFPPENYPHVVPSHAAAEIAVASAERGAHGEAVSASVREATEDTEPGPERGRAVAQAACPPAHDPSTLPEFAQAHSPPASAGANCPGDEGNAETAEGRPESPGGGVSGGANRPDGVPPSFPGQGNPPVSAPPSDPGPPQGAPGNPVGAPPVSAPPTDPGPPQGSPGNPVGAPSAGPAQGGTGNAGPPDLPPPAQPPVEPGPPTNRGGGQSAPGGPSGGGP
jgi:hypothetical protein